MADLILSTDRLLLRPWRESDLKPFAAMNADPVVMEYFAKPLDRSESDAMVARIMDHFDSHGFGFWAVEATESSSRLDRHGRTGRSRENLKRILRRALEIGWRLAREHWGKGYATEAARAALRYGFERLGLSEIVAFTVPQNVRSRAVMDKIGMTRSAADDFDHPSLPEGHRLRRHVLYRVRQGPP